MADSDGSLVVHENVDLLGFVNQISEPALVAYLRAVWFGDMACSGGEHSSKGTDISLEEILSTRTHPYSDDLIQNLTVTYLSYYPGSQDEGANVPERLASRRAKFLRVLRPYVEAAPLSYGRTLPLLLRDDVNPVEVCAGNRGSGAAMRSGILAVLDQSATDSYILEEAGITHLHPESLTGAYIVARVAQALIQGRPVAAVYQMLPDYANNGQRFVTTLLRALDLPVPRSRSLAVAIAHVLSLEDPYWPVSDLATTWTSAAYVVPCALLVLRRALNSNVGLVEGIVRSSYSFGGDPDTVCSIALGLANLCEQVSVQAEITNLVLRHRLPDFFSLD